MTGPVPGDTLAARVVAWQRIHGRHGLPWQGSRDPYRVWLSEVMLQQTQVSVVRDYYQRFLDRWPTVADLAAAPLDDVLGVWSGLGYYSRARNLHRCAQEVMARFAGAFPDTQAQLQTLPGIGRSTAAAIAAFCFGERVAILDGNVKRVLTRALAFGEDLASAAAERRLWDLASALVPADSADMPAYTQGLMDLGATVCLARTPHCLLCPLGPVCAAHGQGRPEAYPVKTRTRKRSAQPLWLLLARRDDGAVWLDRRPVPGVWAGLWCLPLFDTRAALDACVPGAQALEDLPAFTHVLTHKDLHLHPVLLPTCGAGPGPACGGAWVAADRLPSLGLPAPVRRLLAQG